MGNNAVSTEEVRILRRLAERQGPSAADVECAWRSFEL